MTEEQKAQLWQLVTDVHDHRTSAGSILVTRVSKLIAEAYRRGFKDGAGAEYEALKHHARASSDVGNDCSGNAFPARKQASP